jgi:hypothetical protein
MTSFIPALAHNPVARAEFHYQRFVIRNGRVGIVWIVLAGIMVVPALLVSLVFTVAGLAALVIPQAANVIPFSDLISIPMEYSLSLTLLATMAIAMYLVVTLVNLGLSANSISREKSGGTWDVLRLTGIGAGRIVLGKWWASLRALNGDFVMVTVIRLGVVVFYLVSLAPVLDQYEAISSGLATTTVITRSLAYLPYLPVLLLITILYGIADAALTAALGIIAAIPDAAAGSVTGTLVVSFRLITMVVAGMWFLVTLNGLRSDANMAIFGMTLIGIIAYALCLAGTLWVGKKLVY